MESSKKVCSAVAERADVPSPYAPSPDALIDAFCDALWLEDGLAKNSLAA